MSMQLIHFLGTVVTAEYEKLEKKDTALQQHIHRIIEIKSTDSEASQINAGIPSVPCSFQVSNTNIKHKRPKYSDDEQRKVIEIYDSFPCKIMAMKAINEMHGFESIYKRKIERWKRSDKSMGRPVSQEFEKEVIEEYINTYKKSNRNNNSHLSVGEMNLYVNNSSLKKCALVVWDREYWDEKTNAHIKKWHTDKLTCNLRFTGKWIGGLLKRSKKTTSDHKNKCDVIPTSASHNELKPSM